MRKGATRSFILRFSNGIPEIFSAELERGEERKKLRLSQCLYSNLKVSESDDDGGSGLLIDYGLADWIFVFQ